MVPVPNLRRMSSKTHVCKLLPFGIDGDYYVEFRGLLCRRGHGTGSDGEKQNIFVQVFGLLHECNFTSEGIAAATTLVCSPSILGDPTTG